VFVLPTLDEPVDLYWSWEHRTEVLRVKVPLSERRANGAEWAEAVLAERSTDEGGEVRPKRPAGGKAKPGVIFVPVNHRRDIEFTNCVNETGADCRAVNAQS